MLPTITFTLTPFIGVPLIAELSSYANTKTYYRRKAEAMGFTFSHVNVEEWGLMGMFSARGSFKCVCGREEYFQFSVTDTEIAYGNAAFLFDIGRRLQDFGSFSREHLLHDGYTLAQVEAILEKGVQFEYAERSQRNEYAVHQVESPPPAYQRRSSRHKEPPAYVAMLGLPVGAQVIGRLAGHNVRGRVDRSRPRRRDSRVPYHP